MPAIGLGLGLTRGGASSPCICDVWATAEAGESAPTPVSAYHGDSDLVDVYGVQNLANTGGPVYDTSTKKLGTAAFKHDSDAGWALTRPDPGSEVLVGVTAWVRRDDGDASYAALCRIGTGTDYLRIIIGEEQGTSTWVGFGGSIGGVPWSMTRTNFTSEDVWIFMGFTIMADGSLKLRINDQELRTSVATDGWGTTASEITSAASGTVLKWADEIAFFTSEITTENFNWLYNSGNGREFVGPGTEPSVSPTSVWTMDNVEDDDEAADSMENINLEESQSLFDVTGHLGPMSVLFDGTGDYLTASNSNISTDEVSVSVWFTANEVPGSGDCAGLLDNRDRAGTNKGWTLELCEGGVAFSIYTSTSWTSSPIASVGDGVRYHAVGTYDGSNLRLYLDGALQSTTAVTGDIVYDSSSTVRFGAEQYGDRDYDGALHGVRVYDDALTLAEVQTLRANGDVTSGETGHWAWDGDLTDVYGANATSYGNATLKGATAVSLPDFGTLEGQELTFATKNSWSGWIKPTSYYHTGIFHIIDYDEELFSYSLKAEPDSGSSLQYTLYVSDDDNEVYNSVVIGSSIPVGSWVHWAIAFEDGVKATAWINGVKGEMTTDIPDMDGWDQNMTLHDFYNVFSVAYFDETLHFDDYTLTDDNVAYLWNSGTGRSHPWT